jgi:hypothetical protein
MNSFLSTTRPMNSKISDWKFFASYVSCLTHSALHHTQSVFRQSVFVISALVLLVAGNRASGFSFWGPAEAYQDQIIGYRPLVVFDHPFGSTTFTYQQDFAYAPHNLAEEYRWNVPILYYSYDPTFVEYFGSNGVHAVDAAATLLNAIPKASEINPDDFPLDEFRFNYTANAFHLFDLKSAALEALVTRLGLADPETWTWAIHDREPLPGGCPNFLYTIIQRNFDPITWQPSRFVNGNLFTYFIDQPCPPDIRMDHADAVELRVNTTLDTVLTAVASPKITYPNINYWGMFHTGLTRDDVAGLRYLYHTNNMNFEQAAPDVQLFETNNAPVPLFSSNLTLFAAQALTNSAAALQALYPGLIVTSSSNFYTTTRTTNVVANLVPGPPWAPAGTFQLVFTTNFGPFTLQTNFVHTFGNVVTFQFINGQWVIQPLTTFQTNGFQIVNFQTITTVITNPPFLPANDFIVNTTTNNRLRLEVGPVGEFFIMPTNFCDLNILSVAFTNVIPVTTVLLTGTNGAAATNFFNGEILFQTQNFISFFTNHLFLVSPIICSNDTVALRSGVDKVTFIRHDYDPLLSRFFRPVTNDFTDIAETTNHIRYLEHFRRVVTRPDIIFSAADLFDTGFPYPINYDAGPGFLTASNTAPPIAVAGPGAFVGQMAITFNKGGPIYFNVSPLGITEQDSLVFYIWGSFDGSTNDPIIYPDTLSMMDLERAFAMSIQPDYLPNAIVGQFYSATVTVYGGQPPYSWALYAHSLPLPPGLSFAQDPNDSSQLIISGTPTASGTFPFTLEITDGTGLTVDALEGISVNPP